MKPSEARPPRTSLSLGGSSPRISPLGSTGRRHRAHHDLRVLLTALGAGAPAVLISMIMLWGGDYTPKVQWTLSVLILGFWLGFCFALRERVVQPLQTLSNLLAALREGDYSIRARGASREEALGQVMLEANALGETLRSQRLGALEATTLLRKVMEEIEVAVFTFDEHHRLSLVNRADERLLARSAERLLRRTALELGLSDCLEGEAAQTIQKTFPGKSGRWGLRRSSFRESGLPHQMLVLSDLSQALREEERQAWQRLIRVIGHELNNSLTPIKSMAATLAHLLEREPTPPDWKEDAKRVLDVIAERSESLSRFMGAYARLARLPHPSFEPLDVGTWVQRVATLETRLPVSVSSGPALVIQADASQLEQLLINLIHNAVDASQETEGGVRVGWRAEGESLEVWVEDDGPGFSNTSNLFVPFFTTKAEGSGIGLVLSRQIAEAHGGNLTLKNRDSEAGCVATLRLPLAAGSS